MGSTLAFDIKVSGISKANNETLFELELPWWDELQLRKDSRFKQEDIDQSYFDYIAYLSVDELRKLHEQFRAEATSGVYKDADWQKRIQPIMKELDEVIYASPDQYAYFRVHVYEWESGF